MKKLFASRTLRFIIAASLSGVLLYFIFGSLEWQETIAALQRFNPLWFLPVVVLVLLSMGLHALRWQLILKPAKEIPASFLFEAIILGRFVNLILPIKIGPLVQAYLVKKKFQVSLFTVLGTFAVEQVVGSIVFGLIGLVVVLIVPVPAELANIRRLVLFGLGTIVALLALLLLMTVLISRLHPGARNLAQKLIHRISPRWSEVFAGHFRNFRRGLHLGSNWGEAVAILLYSVGIRLVVSSIMLCVARGFGITLPFLIYLLLDILVTLAHGIGDHVLGLIGTFEVSLTYSLTFFGVASETGLSIALLIDAILITPIIVLGLIFFLRGDLTWTELTHLRKQSLPTFSNRET